MSAYAGFDRAWVRARPDAALELIEKLEAKIVEQADRIAWLEGEVAGWRIKLAECEERQR